MIVLALAMFLQPQPAQPPPDDFDLLPREAAPDAAAIEWQKELERKLVTRRQMLQLHQLGGLLTLGSLGATVVLGQLNYDDKYGGGGDTGKYIAWHRWIALTSAGIFAATGALAIFAPSPIPKEVRFDTATLHKVAMAVA